MCVSVGELRDAIGLFGPRELRAMSMCDGFVVIPLLLHYHSLPPIDCNNGNSAFITVVRAL